MQVPRAQLPGARALSFRGGAVALTRTVDLSHVVHQDALSPGRDLEPLGPADRPWGRTRSGCFHSAPCHPWSSLWGEAPAPLEQGTRQPVFRWGAAATGLTRRGRGPMSSLPQLTAISSCAFRCGRRGRLRGRVPATGPDRAARQHQRPLAEATEASLPAQARVPLHV